MRSSTNTNVAILATKSCRTLAQIFSECEQRRGGMIGLFSQEMKELIASAVPTSPAEKEFVATYSKNTAWEPQTRLVVKASDVLRFRRTEKAQPATATATKPTEKKE